MPEYHILRAVLGLMQFAIAVLIVRRDVGYLFSFGVYMYVSFALNIAPALPTSEAYKLAVQIPAFVLLVILTIAASIELFTFLYRRTFRRERVLLVYCAAILAAVPITCGWIWRVENPYQAMMVIRQYALIGVTVATSFAWYWVRHIRPVKIEPQVSLQGVFWCCWIATTALLSTSTKGGLLWLAVNWEGGEGAWRYFSDVMLLGQILLCACFTINLHYWRAPVVSIDGRDR